VNVLLVSRSRDTLDELEGLLGKYDELRLERRLVVNGHVDPMHGVEKLPGVLVLHLSPAWQEELASLARRPPAERPPLIVLGPSGDMAAMRAAMQAGARDFLPMPVDPGELLAALTRLVRDRQATRQAAQGTVTAFMNAKGGSGASLLACNVAHIMTVVSGKQVALLDFDLQFGTLPLYLDLYPKRGLLQALANLDDLDEVAIDAYLTAHRSGLKVLGHAADDPLSSDEVGANQVERLLDLIAGRAEHLVVDLPRRIDAVSSAVIDRASQVVVVVQQSVTTLRDAARVLQILRRDLAVPRERLTLVVNRYDKNAAVTLDDIEKSLGFSDLTLVPNDFRTVSECIDSGTPLHESARGAAITRAVMALETRLGGSSAAARPGLIARTFGSLLKSRSH